MFWVFLIAVCCVPAVAKVIMEGLKARDRSGEDPVRLLAARFAAGEIDEYEYARRMEVLTGERAPLPPHDYEA